MTCPIKVAYIRESFGPNMEKRYIVCLDQDAAEIMGEPKTRYIYESKIGAQRFVNTLQNNLDAAYKASCLHH